MIFVINPGSTSTKLGLFRDSVPVKAETFSHSSTELARFHGIWEQFPYRLEICKKWIAQRSVTLTAVVSMGGLLRPLDGGVYAVNDAMRADARANIQGEHASNLGCELAHAVAETYRCPAYVVDPVSVDEFEPLARYSGHPLVKRRSLSHALNIHAAARKAAAELGKPLEETSLIVAHLGGGISIAPVRGGKIVDVNDAASDGPFSPERTGGLPLQHFISLCFSGKYTEPEMRKLVMGRGGLAAYLGTNSLTDVEEMIRKGDTHAAEVFGAMAYQIAKEIGAMATVLNGAVDGIVLTGGAARSKLLTDRIIEPVQFIAPVILYPGEDEMLALAEGALRILQSKEPIREY